MPDLMGRTEEQARQAIENANLVVGQVDKVESQKPEGEVVYQSVEAGIEVDEGTTVSLQISMGSSSTPSPTPTTGTNNPGGDQVYTRSFPIDLQPAIDAGKEKVVITVKLDGDTVYEKEWETSQKMITVDIAQKAGSYEMNTYFDGVLTYNQVEDFPGK
jgi:serine/threonine-protein kinase